MYTRNQTMLGASNSSLTSGPHFVGDFATLTFSRITSTGSAATMEIQGTNWDGFQSAIPEGAWSTLTVIAPKGNFTIDPGMSWIRSIRTAYAVSANSNESHIYEGRAIR